MSVSSQKSLLWKLQDQLLGHAFAVRIPTRMRRMLWVTSAVVVALALHTAPANAQQPGQQNPQLQGGGISPQSNWADSLKMARAENEALTRILSAIESIDTARQNELIQWIITDRSVRSRVISALRKSGKNISPNSVAELTITQKPPTANDPDPNNMQLLRLVIESVGVYGEPNIRRILGEDLYNKIQSRHGYEFTLVANEPEQKKIQFVYMDASLFGGQIIFKSGFGFSLRVGNDYIGYPFWLPGTIGTFGLLRKGSTDFRIGLEWPLGESGVSPFGGANGIQIKQRKLEGAQTFAASIDQDLGLGTDQSGKVHGGADFITGFTPGYSGLSSRVNQEQFRTSYINNQIPGVGKDSLFYVALSAHAWVEYRMPESVLRGAYFQIGAGAHKISALTIGAKGLGVGLPTTDVINSGSYTYFDPLLKIGYVHTGDAGDDYGISVQYCNTLLTDGFIKLFPWLQIEAKYATIIGRDPQKWEWKDFVMISPKIIFNF